MTIKAANIHAHEIIGLGAKIIDSTDLALNCKSGTIVFETRNTISIRIDSTIKQIVKNVARTIEIQTHDGVCFISGTSMIGRPEDRVSRLN
jgi:RNase P/RNase MRP subunit p29